MLNLTINPRPKSTAATIHRKTPQRGKRSLKITHCALPCSLAQAKLADYRLRDAIFIFYTDGISDICKCRLDSLSQRFAQLCGQAGGHLHIRKALFAVDPGPNLHYFVAPLFAPGLIYSKKITNYHKYPIKPGPLFVDLYISRKSLYSRHEQGIITVDFRLRIENKHL